jgi:hypothetical protein
MGGYDGGAREEAVQGREQQHQRSSQPFLCLMKNLSQLPSLFRRQANRHVFAVEETGFFC